MFLDSLSTKNKIIFLVLVALVITIVIAVVIFPILKSFNNGNSENFNGSGYGFRKSFGKPNTLIAQNHISKSTDFKLLSLISQLKFSFIKPASNYKITGTNQGIISKTSRQLRNVIIFPGNADYKLSQNGREVYPSNCNNIDNTKSAFVSINSDGHLNPIYTLLDSCGYKKDDRVFTVKYDFRKFNIDDICLKLSSFMKNEYENVIIGYDFGCVIANICINALEQNERDRISKYLMICPTLGGLPMTLRDYFSGNNIMNPELLTNYQSILMSMPNDIIFNKHPVAVFQSLSYNSTNLSELLKKANKPVQEYEMLKNIQDLSLQMPMIKTKPIIICNNQYKTPICYNFKDNLNHSPESYDVETHNYTGASPVDKLEGIMADGDLVVPFDSIIKLKQIWNDNCHLEIIKNKDHFTILKSYELALIILANL